MTGITVPDLLASLRRLPPWRRNAGFSARDISAYEEAARLVQGAAPKEVQEALATFQIQADLSAWIDNETRLFLLMRFVFDLPESAPAAERHIFWGWVNWPEPGQGGQVNLSWPFSFASGRPVLLAGFEGAEGACDAAVEEYRDLLARFPFRRPHSESS